MGVEAPVVLLFTATSSGRRWRASDHSQPLFRAALPLEMISSRAFDFDPSAAWLAERSFRHNGAAISVSKRASMAVTEPWSANDRSAAVVSAPSTCRKRLAFCEAFCRAAS